MTETELRYLSHIVRNANEGLSDLFAWVIERFFRTKPNYSKPKIKVWLCAGYYIYPSLSLMIRFKDEYPVKLSIGQKRFIMLLLESPDTVERDVTRRAVYDIDTTARSSDAKDNDIDQFVSFFRRHFGRRSIRTVPRVGHFMRARRHLCEGTQLEQALSLLDKSLTNLPRISLSGYFRNVSSNFPIHIRIDQESIIKSLWFSPPYMHSLTTMP